VTMKRYDNENLMIIQIEEEQLNFQVWSFSLRLLVFGNVESAVCFYILQ
jgi:hypothetical protein